MVLRKPYAFFIKNFRLMHIILTICCFYLIVKTLGVINFLSSYLSSEDLVIGQQIVKGLYSFPMFAMPILVIIFLGVVLFVMIIKEKPKMFYIVNIAVYIFTFILFIYGRGVIASMEKEIVSPRTVKSLYDMEVYALVFQIISIIFIGIRAIGFDLKKFDFSKDLQALDVSSEDNEEFEVAINFDIDDTKRRFKRGLRHFKYTYIEHRLIINTIIVIVIALAGYTFYKNSSYSITRYKPGREFSMNNFSITVENAYLVNTDYAGNELDQNVLLVKLKLKCLNNKNKKLITGAFSLVTDDGEYKHSDNNATDFKDIGEVYYTQDIENESYYLLTFNVGNDKLKNLRLKVSNIVTNDYIFVDLKYTNLTEHSDAEEYEVGDEILFSEKTENNIKLTINDYDIQEKYKINYKYCVDDDTCIDSIEYLTPDIFNSSYDLALLKLNIDYESDNNMDNFFKFLSTYGHLEYTLNDEEKVQKIPFKQVKSNSINFKSTYFIEVLKEVMDADKVDLVINIRNNEYVYNLK